MVLLHAARTLAAIEHGKWKKKTVRTRSLEYQVWLLLLLSSEAVDTVYRGMCIGIGALLDFMR